MVVASEIVCILAGMLALIAGYYPSNMPSVAIGCFVTGLLWLLSQWRHWTWVASLGFFVFVCAAGMGVWIGLSPILMAFSVLVSLLAWDLADFSRRLRGAVPEDDLGKHETRHLVRAAILGGIGLVLILVALYIHVRISFGWMFLLTIASVAGMIQLANHLRRDG